MPVLLALAGIAANAYQAYKQGQDQENRERFQAEQIGKSNEERRKEALSRAIGFKEYSQLTPSRAEETPPGESNLSFARTMQGIASSAGALPWKKWGMSGGVGTTQSQARGAYNA